MSKHTEGPWFVTPADEWRTASGEHVQFGRYDISAGSVDPAAPDYYRIGSVSNVNDSPVNEANAQLFKAAPDLLEALQDLILNINAAMGSGGWVPTPLRASFWAAVGDSHDAIARATAGAGGADAQEVRG